MAEIVYLVSFIFCNFMYGSIDFVAKDNHVEINYNTFTFADNIKNGN